MNRSTYSSRTADKFVVRLPDGMRERIHAMAECKHRSMNSQVVFWLEHCLQIEEENPEGFSKEALLEAFSKENPADCVIVPMQQPTFVPAVGSPVRFNDKNWILKQYYIKDDGSVGAYLVGCDGAVPSVALGDLRPV